MVKKIIWIILGLIGVVILAGMYKFNYLASQKGYDVDGNKVELSYYEELEKECDLKTSKNCCLASLNRMKAIKAHKLENGQKCQKGYKREMMMCIDSFVWCEKEKNSEGVDKKELEKRLKKIGIRIEKVHDEFYDQDVEETIFSGIQPIKNLSQVDRNSFRAILIADLKVISKKNIQKNFSGIKDQDFKNTGKLKYQADFDILLNNILIRTGLEPQNWEHLESLIDDLETKKSKERMSVKIPKWRFSEKKNDFIIDYFEYEVPKNKAILYEIFRKMFEINGDANQYWNGLDFEKVNLINGKADIYLAGDWHPVGDMSGAYMKHEIEAAAFQFSNVKQIEVFLNGKTFDWCVDDESDGEGGCNKTSKFWKVESK